MSGGLGSRTTTPPRGTPGNPVCAFHGKTASEHEHGRCLYCCLCFTDLSPDECWQDPSGQKWDVCEECKAQEPEWVPW